MSSLDLNKPVAEQSRVELTLAQMANIWKYRSRGPEFAVATLDFFKRFSGDDKINTFRSYSFAILEFFDWYHRYKNIIPTPAQVTPGNVTEYVEWLKTRKQGLDGFRIQNDPQRVLDDAIFKFVDGHPRTGITEIRAELVRRRIPVPMVNIEGVAHDGLASHLSCLVSRKSLVRSPTTAEIRAGLVNVHGEDPKRFGIDWHADPTNFKYTTPVVSKTALERSGTISSRLLALSAFWSYLCKRVSNEGSSEPLLRSNHWAEPLSEIMPKAKSNAKDTRVKHAPNTKIFERLLATTYTKTHGENALRAAIAKNSGQRVEEPTRRTSTVDLRDRAILLLAVQMGLRAQEICDINWKDRSPIVESTSILTVTGKGQKKRPVAFTPAVYSAVKIWEEKLVQIGLHRYPNPKDESLALAMVDGKAPIFPAVIYWGHNAKFRKKNNRITRQGIDAIFRRRARQAGLSVDDYKKAHPHGLRRLFAVSAMKKGTPINRVQAILGHESLVTTGRYVDQFEPGELMAEAYMPKGVQVVSEREEALERLVEPVRALPEEIRAKPKFDAKPRAVQVQKKLEEASSAMAEPGPKTKGELKKQAREASKLLVEMVYAKDTWGERGRSQKLVEASRAAAIGEASAKESAQAVPLLPDEEDESFDPTAARGAAAAKMAREAGSLEDIQLELKVNKIRSVYIGKDSGLLWWYGPSNKLRPELPIIAPSQVGVCSVDEQSDLCAMLSNLWMQWATGDEPDRGPTAASALALWVTAALDVSGQVATEGLFRQADWIPFDDDLSVTRAGTLKGQDRKKFREHQPTAIASWFEDTAWKYKSTGGGGGFSEKKRDKQVGGRKKLGRRAEFNVDDSSYQIPDYYALPDPILALPLDERNEMLDWVASFTGQKIWDRSPIFGQVSRVDVAEFLELVCAFDKAADELRKAMRTAGGAAKLAAERDDKLIELNKAAVNEAKELVRQKVETISGGRTKDFDIHKDRTARAATRRGNVLKVEKTTGSEESQVVGADRSGRQQSYLATVATLFGQKAASDAAIIYAARCGKLSTATDDMKEFFRIDRSYGTIVHTKEKKENFAKESWTHSECLARRVARDLWEARKTKKPGSVTKERLKDFAATIVRMQNTYRIPCPRVYESELRSMLDFTRKDLPIFEVWSKKFGDQTIQGRLLGAEGEDESTYYERATGGMTQNQPKYTPNGTYIPNRAAVRMMPTPVALLFVVFG